MEFSSAIYKAGVEPVVPGQRCAQPTFFVTGTARHWPPIVMTSLAADRGLVGGRRGKPLLRPDRDAELRANVGELPQLEAVTLVLVPPLEAARPAPAKRADALVHDRAVAVREAESDRLEGVGRERQLDLGRELSRVLGSDELRTRPARTAPPRGDP